MAQGAVFGSWPVARALHQLGGDIIVTSETELMGSTGHQRVESRAVRIMAGSALASLDRGMRTGRSNVFGVVTGKTDSILIVDQSQRIVGIGSFVTGLTFALGHRVVNGVCEESVRLRGVGGVAIAARISSDRIATVGSLI
jgi:hypothetical protein